MALLLNHKNTSAGLLSTIPTGIKVMALLC